MLCLSRLIFLMISFISVMHCKFCTTNKTIPHSQYSHTISAQLTLAGCQITTNDLIVTLHDCCEGYYRQGKNCIPECKHGCENGQCTEPNICSCNKGYTPVEGRCVLMCSNCTNGHCVAPDQCICNAGYAMNTKGLCDSKCKDGCVNGICNEQNQCVCREGYFFNEKLLELGIKKNTVCTPKCDRPCPNGICVGRNQCKCDSGYTARYPYNCVPICDPQWVNCTYGLCKAPNACQCNEGYILVKNKCIPECHPACVNGNCIAPGECNCLQGYQIANDSNICEPLCDPPCENGFCVSVNQCRFFNSTSALAENISYVLIPIVAGATLTVWIIIHMIKCLRGNKEHTAAKEYFSKDCSHYWSISHKNEVPEHREVTMAMNRVNTKWQVAVDNETYGIITE